MLNTFLTSENPLLCTPEEAIPIRTSFSLNLSCDQVFFIYYTNCKTSQVVLIYRIESRHLSSLSADQCRIRLYAAFCYTAYDLSDLFRIVLAAGNVIQAKNSGSPPAQAISFTHMATQSMPTVSCLSRINASFSFVPTPSVPETSVGFFHVFEFFHGKCTGKSADIGQYFTSHGLLDVLFH